MAEEYSPCEAELIGDGTTKSPGDRTPQAVSPAYDVEGEDRDVARADGVEEHHLPKAAVVDALYGVKTENWARLADNFRPGLENASDNLKQTGFGESDSGFQIGAKTGIAYEIQRLVKSVVAAKEGRQPNSPNDELSTPAGALQQLFDVCKTFGLSNERALQLIRSLTTQPGLIFEVMQVSEDQLVADNLTTVGGPSRAQRNAQPGRIPGSRSGLGTKMTQADETGIMEA